MTTTGVIAFAASDSIALPKTATLVARGVGIDFAIRYSCQSSDTNAGIKMDVKENSGGYIAHGSYENYGMLTCDGHSHVKNVVVTADQGGRAFTRGQAYVDYADLLSNFVPTASTSGTVTVTK